MSYRFPPQDIFYEFLAPHLTDWSEFWQKVCIFLIKSASGHIYSLGVSSWHTIFCGTSKHAQICCFINARHCGNCLRRSWWWKQVIFLSLSMHTFYIERLMKRTDWTKAHSTTQHFAQSSFFCSHIVLFPPNILYYILQHKKY